MSEELLPCPFCGYKHTQVLGTYAGDPYYPDEDKSRPPTLWRANCPNCGADHACHDKKEWAIEAWNHRATPKPADSAGDVVRHAIEYIERITIDERKYDKKDAYGTYRAMVLIQCRKAKAAISAYEAAMPRRRDLPHADEGLRRFIWEHSPMGETILQQYDQKRALKQAESGEA